MLNRITIAEKLRDGSGKHGEAFVRWLAPDLKRTARKGFDRITKDDCHKIFLDCSKPIAD
jgi:hypothetical protein